MSIAPIVRSVEVKVAPARAFEIFTDRFGDWWPKGKTIGKAPHVSVVFEPWAGGQWFERDAQGIETKWGRVLAWEPPSRLLLSWQINAQWSYDPDVLTEVEVTFVQAAGGGTLVTLEHRHLERLGAEAEAYAAQIGGGWPKMLGEFVRYADGNS